MIARLVTLTTDHAEMLEAFLADFDSAPGELHGYFCPRSASIDQVVTALNGWSEGRNLGEGWVPCSTWFWREGDTLQGVINIRHYLSPALEKTGGHIGYSVAPSHRRKGVAKRMLGAAIEHCRRLGIERAFLTCDAKNTGSWRAIEANGGVMETEAWHEKGQRVQRSYWIDLDG